VKVNRSEVKAEGRILLPVLVQSRPTGGEVVTVGEGRSVGSNNIETNVPVCILLHN
jgi:chaperonin GroES